MMERRNQEKGAKTGLGSGASARTTEGTALPGTPLSYTVLPKANPDPDAKHLGKCREQTRKRSQRGTHRV